MYSIVLMVLTSVTIIYALNNLVNLVMLDSQTSEEIGELLPTSDYVYTTLNYIFRLVVIYVGLGIMESRGFPLTESNVFWVVMGIIAFSTIVATLSEALLRTAVLLLRPDKEEGDNV